MEQINPFDININIDKSKLNTYLSGKKETDIFGNIENIRDSINDYFPTPKNGYVKLIKFNKKLIGMDEKVTIEEHNGDRVILMTLRVGKPSNNDGEMNIVNEDGKILYQVKEGEITLFKFFVYIKIDKFEDENNIKFKGKTYLLVRGIETVRGELELILKKAVFHKKAKIKIKNSLTPKDIKLFGDKINNLEILGDPINEGDSFLNLEDNKKEDNLKFGFIIKGKGLLEKVNFSIYEKFFKKKPEIKASLKIGKKTRIASINSEDLTIMMKSDIIDSKEQYNFKTFKKKCLETDFGYNQPISTIK